MGGCLRRRRPRAGSVGEEAPYQVFGPVGDGLPIALGKNEIRSLNQPQRLSVVLTQERGVPAERHVQHNAAGPNVAPVVILPALGHLRRHVDNLPNTSPEECVTFLKASRRAKINQLDIAVDYWLLGLQQHVLRPQVAVADAARVQVADAGQDLRYHSSSLALCKVVLPQNALEELAARAILDNKVKVDAVLVDLKELDNVGVVQLLEDGRHVLELVECCVLLVHALHGVSGLCVPVDDPPDAAVAALLDPRGIDIVGVTDIANIDQRSLAACDDEIHGQPLLQLLHQALGVAFQVVHFHDSVANAHLLGAARSVPQVYEAVGFDLPDKQRLSIGAVNLYAQARTVGLVHREPHQLGIVDSLPAVHDQRPP
mmetsp:Transcript_77584/g.179894  ORF Transcript_77584/g.179894 Transcript_77584/m.179894 type:complete len:371 (+) Transcript_77584:727-1839(+)